MRALVIGGMSGIGAATAARLREAGHDVVVWDRTQGADVVVDIGRAQEITAAMATTLRTGPPPQLVALCAGTGGTGLILEQPPEEWERILGVNLTGAWLTIRAVAGALVDHALEGSIVVVSSVSGTLVDRSMGAYCVSKAGVDMLVKVAAAELGEHGICVNAVGPGVTRTPFLGPPDAHPGWLDALANRTALGRLGEADDIAAAITAVLDLRWVTGQIIHADGGFTLHSPLDIYGETQ
jgi:NAD(P)-dependent dehydrogenase (short-subunit alcohol dehydrogenase family)